MTHEVLIIDDSPAALAVAKARLAREGLSIRCADGGREGLAALEQALPDLVLLDVDMPDISGFQICQRLKSDARTSLVPIIFLTAADDVASKVRGLDLGAVDYVTKPFDAFELRARVRAALRTKRLQDLLVRHADIDPLTELNNRRVLDRRLDACWTRSRAAGAAFCFVIGDIDHFKTVNDTYGHRVGDEVLRAVAASLRDTVRVQDVPGRWGGEEFGIVVPNVSLDAATKVAERCRRAVAAVAIPIDGGEVRVTASFGVAESRPFTSVSQVVEAADAALYRAKDEGRDRVVPAPGVVAAPTPVRLVTPTR